MLARCRRAARAGVRVGMSLAHARALVGKTNVLIEPSTPQRDEKALGCLAQWANRFSPVVAPDPPDGLLVDTTGCSHLFGGEGRLLGQLTEAVGRLGFDSRGAIAPTVGCAWAVARHGAGHSGVVWDGDLHDTLGPLPTCSLRIEDHVVESLHEMGVDRVDHLLALPRSQLPSRFGPQLLLRLDQAFGRTMEPIEPYGLRDPLHVERVFDGATTRFDAIEQATQELVSKLCERLKTHERGARCLCLVLDRLDAGPEQIDVTLSEPSRKPKHLWALLRPRLERVNLGFGVQEIVLTALRATGLPHEQTHHWPAERRANHGPKSGELIDTLVNRFGSDRVTRIEPIQTHMPERACRDQPVDQPKRHAVCTRPPPADRPSMLLDQPEPVEVIAATPDGPVAGLRFDGVGCRVVSSIGPERIAPPWWQSDGGDRKCCGPSDKQVRDYFKVQDAQGRWLWVFRDLATRQWFLHGRWA